MSIVYFDPSSPDLWRKAGWWGIDPNQRESVYPKKPYDLNIWWYAYAISDSGIEWGNSNLVVYTPVAGFDDDLYYKGQGYDFATRYWQFYVRDYEDQDFWWLPIKDQTKTG